MALVRGAKCPTCGQVYSAVVDSYEYGTRELIKKCGECTDRELDAEIVRERDAAWATAVRLVPDPTLINLVGSIVHSAEMQVIREQLFGHKELPAYWRKVASKIK